MKPWRRGGTAGNLGLAWGWRTLSPSWRGLWGDADLPLDYDTDFMEKVVVILTDGNNEFYDLTDSDDDPDETVGLHRLRPRQRARSRRPEQDDDRRRRHRPQRPHARDLRGDEGSCWTASRRSGSTRSSSTPASAEHDDPRALSDCATTPAMYYYAPDNASLASAFKAIGGQLANLRIVE